MGAHAGKQQIQRGPPKPRTAPTSPVVEHVRVVDGKPFLITETAWSDGGIRTFTVRESGGNLVSRAGAFEAFPSDEQIRRAFRRRATSRSLGIS